MKWLKQLSAGKKIFLAIIAVVAINAASHAQPTSTTSKDEQGLTSSQSNKETINVQEAPAKENTVSPPSSNGSTSSNGDVVQDTPDDSNNASASTPPAEPSCDPNYSGACVPNVYPSDVDCAGGSGNGPYYVQGPVQVIGTDHYGLDRDGDGTACE